MTVRIERSADIPLAREKIWEFIADPEKRASAISVVESFDLHDEEGTRATWHIDLPIPMLRATVDVETKDLVRDPPRYVKFEGRSRMMHVIGEHELTEIENGTRLTTRFVVDGRLPGVEAFFERNLDRELRNIVEALLLDLGLDPADFDLERANR